MKSKNKLLTCFISFIIWVLIYPITIYMLYYLYIKVRFGGKHFISFLYHSYISNGDKLFALLGIPLEESHGLLYVIQAIISVLGLLIFVGLPILLIPGILLAIANKVSEVTTVIRKNAWCDYCQTREDALHKPHKERENGDEWLRKKKERESSKSKASYSSYHSSAGQGYSDYDQQSSEYQQQTSGSQQPMDDVEIARITFMLNSLNFTEKELKTIRNRLIKGFHSDNGEENEEFAQKINQYYSVLKPYAKK